MLRSVRRLPASLPDTLIPRFGSPEQSIPHVPCLSCLIKLTTAKKLTHSALPAEQTSPSPRAPWQEAQSPPSSSVMRRGMKLLLLSRQLWVWVWTRMILSVSNGLRRWHRYGCSEGP